MKLIMWRKKEKLFKTHWLQWTPRIAFRQRDKPPNKEPNQPIVNLAKTSDSNNIEVIKKWPKGTVAIVGDSIISNKERPSQDWQTQRQYILEELNLRCGR